LKSYKTVVQVPFSTVDIAVKKKSSQVILFKDA